MQVDERRCSCPRRRCCGDHQLEICARHISAAAEYFPTVSAVGQKCLSMRRPTPIHPVCRRSPRASSCRARTNVDKCRVPSPTALIGPCSSLRAAALGRLVGSEAEKLECFKMAIRFAYRGWLPWRRFVACPDHMRRITKRRPMALSGPWRPNLHIYYTA